MSPTSGMRRARDVNIGVISDTHGLLRPEALAALAGVDHLVHAGDIGSPELLERLRGIAPLTVVRGNNDKAAWAEAIPPFARLQLNGHGLFVIHDLADMKRLPPVDGVSVVIAGHAHRPKIEWRDGVLHLNPGSAGPRRFSLPVTLALLVLGKTVDARIVPLLGAGPTA